MQDLVSIIVPIYNMENKLVKCLDSICSQTYENYEVLLIDDGSKDNSAEICKTYEKKDKRFKYIYQKNQGVSAARNNGLKQVRGTWVCFIDPDDYLDIDMLKELVEAGEDKTEIDIVMCCCYAETAGKSILNEFYSKERIFSSDKSDLYMELLNKQYMASQYRYTAVGVPWAKIYRYSFLKKVPIEFNKDLKRMQDNIFNWYAFYYAKKIVYINRPLYYYTVEHVKNYADQFDPEAYQYLGKIVEEQEKAMKRIGIADLICYKKVLMDEAIRLYILSAQKSVFANKHITNKMKRKQCLELYRQKYKYFFSVYYTGINIKVLLLKILIYTGNVNVLLYLKRVIQKKE